MRLVVIDSTLTQISITFKGAVYSEICDSKTAISRGVQIFNELTKGIYYL